MNLLHVLNRGEATLLIAVRNDYGHSPLELAQCLPGRKHLTVMLRHLIASLRSKGETEADMVRQIALDLG